MAENYTTSPGFWLVFGIIVLVLAAAALFLASRFLGVSNWHEVEATIIRSSITPIVGAGKGVQKDPEIGSGYRLDVSYEYVAGGQHYESTRVMRGIPAATFPTEPRAKRALEEYAEGTNVSAYVDPGNPANAVLISAKKFSMGAWFGLFMLTSAVIGVFGVLALSHFGVIDPKSHFERFIKGDGTTHISPND
jgi:hypothetical protein